MSCDQEERGTWKVPTSAYMNLKRVVRNSSVAFFDRILSALKKGYERAQDKARGRRITDKGSFLVHEVCLPGENDYYYRHLLSEDRKRFVKPTVKALKKDLTRPTTATKIFEIYSWGGSPIAAITFEDRTRTVTWNVERNNHSVDDARANAVAKAFFAELNRIRWTRGTGGWTSYLDEFMQDDHEAGRITRWEPIAPKPSLRTSSAQAKRLTPRSMSITIKLDQRTLRLLEKKCEGGATNKNIKAVLEDACHRSMWEMLNGKTL